MSRYYHRRRKTKPLRLSDRDLSRWVGSDHGLYLMWVRSRLPKREFIRREGLLLRSLIYPMMRGKEPRHYLLTRIES